MQKISKITSVEYRLTAAFLATFSVLLAIGFLLGIPQLGLSFAMLAAILFGLTGSETTNPLPELK